MYWAFSSGTTIAVPASYATQQIIWRLMSIETSKQIGATIEDITDLENGKHWPTQVKHNK